jgi:2-polyprenyl-3-methyl-5-hydroxy-6-metoxy-1,4-benzoquinol methylase
MHINWKDPESDCKIKKYNNYFISEVGEKYDIFNGIPRFVNNKSYTDNWGIQWNKFRKTQLDSYTKFPLSEDRLRRCLGDEIYSSLNKAIVLEAGCGAGRFTEILLANTAKVVSVDMSSAVEANQKNFPQNEQHFIVQSNILKLPFVTQQFDIVICLGVIQGTPSPETTIKALYGHVKPGGWLVLDHYIFSLSYYTQIVKIISRLILRYIEPKKAFETVNLLTEVFLPLHRIAKSSRLWQAIMRRVTPVVSYYYDFPDLSEELQKEWAFLDTHDILTDYYKHFLTLDQMSTILENLGMERIQCWRGGIGIEARGRRPDTNLRS